MAQGLDKIHATFNTAKGTVQYRVVSASAVWVMGMGNRSTADFDVLVQDGDDIRARRFLLRHHDMGRTSLNSLFITINSKSYNIDILTPSRIRLASFPTKIYNQTTTPAIIAPIDGMLEAKIGAYRDPARKS
jgi:hypothetical protein